jgi:hypothetical protein
MRGFNAMDYTEEGAEAHIIDLFKRINTPLLAPGHHFAVHVIEQRREHCETILELMYPQDNSRRSHRPPNALCAIGLLDAC